MVELLSILVSVSSIYEFIKNNNISYNSEGIKISPKNVFFILLYFITIFYLIFDLIFDSYAEDKKIAATESEIVRVLFCEKNGISFDEIYDGVYYKNKDWNVFNKAMEKLVTSKEIAADTIILKTIDAPGKEKYLKSRVFKLNDDNGEFRIEECKNRYSN